MQTDVNWRDADWNPRVLVALKLSDSISLDECSNDWSSIGNQLKTIQKPFGNFSVYFQRNV